MSLVPGFNLVPATPIPTVNISAPANNTQLPLGTSVNISASASEVGGSVASIAYYVDSTLIGQTSSSSLNWTPPTWGSYQIQAVATDSSGNSSGYSAPITIQIPYIQVSAPDSPSATFSGSTASVVWTESGTNLAYIQNYTIQESDDSGNSWRTIATVPSSSGIPSGGNTSYSYSVSVNTNLPGSMFPFLRVVANSAYGSYSSSVLTFNPYPTIVQGTGALGVAFNCVYSGGYLNQYFNVLSSGSITFSDDDLYGQTRVTLSNTGTWQATGTYSTFLPMPIDNMSPNRLSI